MIAETKARITGVVGFIAWAYHKAATIEGFTVRHQKVDGQSRWSVVANVVHHDALKMRQRPLHFVVPTEKHGEWRWPVEHVELVEEGRQRWKLTARLAPPVELGAPQGLPVILQTKG